MNHLELQQCDAVAGGADHPLALGSWPIDVPLHSLPFKLPPPVF